MRWLRKVKGNKMKKLVFLAILMSFSAQVAHGIDRATFAKQQVNSLQTILSNDLSQEFFGEKIPEKNIFIGYVKSVGFATEALSYLADNCQDLSIVEITLGQLRGELHKLSQIVSNGNIKIAQKFVGNFIDLLKEGVSDNVCDNNGLNNTNAITTANVGEILFKTQKAILVSFKRKFEFSEKISFGTAVNYTEVMKKVSKILVKLADNCSLTKAITDDLKELLRSMKIILNNEDNIKVRMGIKSAGARVFKLIERIEKDGITVADCEEFEYYVPGIREITGEKDPLLRTGEKKEDISEWKKWKRWGWWNLGYEYE